MSASTRDDAFHEIQLNGKQLVFLFMAATVVSVVIFLCGVLVGRGVQAEQATPVDTLVLSDGPAAAAPQQAEAAAPPAAPAVSNESDPRTADAPPAVDDLSYFSRLEQEPRPAENLKPVVEPAPVRAADPAPARPQQERSRERAAAPRKETPSVRTDSPATQIGSTNAPRTTNQVAAPAAVVAPPAARTAAASPAPAPRTGQGDWAVQVAALNRRPEAEAVAKRLSAKGYAAYVVTPGDGTQSVFRVRIGPFRTRREADNMAARLEKEEQFKPWVTR